MAEGTRQDQQALLDCDSGEELGSADASLVWNRKTENVAGGWGRLFVGIFAAQRAPRPPVARSKARVAIVGRFLGQRPSIGDDFSSPRKLVAAPAVAAFSTGC